MQHLPSFVAAGLEELLPPQRCIYVLLRKKETPTGLRDYRPISLIHSFGKLVTKGLALRLAPFMNGLVKENQTAFIKGNS
jgi:hypothetical protein